MNSSRLMAAVLSVMGLAAGGCGTDVADLGSARTVPSYVKEACWAPGFEENEIRTMISGYRIARDDGATASEELQEVYDGCTALFLLTGDVDIFNSCRECGTAAIEYVFGE